MTHEHFGDVEELAVNSCWELLRDAGAGRLRRVGGGPPGHLPGQLRSGPRDPRLPLSRGEDEVAGALTDVPVAVEVDGYDEPSGKARSVVAKGRAERSQQVQELTDTLGLSLFPWQAGRKGLFVRVVPALPTGRRSSAACPGVWRTPLSGARRASDE